MGAVPVVGDVYDEVRLERLVAESQAEIVIHQLTAFGTKAGDPYAETIRVRIDGTRSLIAAEFMILATSLPKSGYSAKAILAVYRLRWQIELAFKRLKSLLHIDQLPTRTERGSQSWLYAHLILALLCDDLSQDFLESSP